ncbi:replicase [Ononis yellow mosaic virus]|uniref:Non-structural replication polyprotein n=1 Tax=Ononis yellow mosaic virus TaxID=12153 RepID=POLN_OYMV|nr:replicase [Ononis yellow mosaic virus]P20127.1 RecName: Full=RNA replicase polyprotein [Ononis yellow mosaic virus]AAA46796.1 replicase protein (RP) [Ononis yellow mosaic virus]
MAFELALNALASSTHKDSSLNPVLNSAVQPLQTSLQNFPWIIGKEHLPFLLAAGIPTSGFGCNPHPHAVHKVIETFLLFNHWSFMATVQASVMFMKPSKFKKLASVNPNFSELVNYRLTAADSVRYPSTSTSLPKYEIVFMHDALMYFNPSQILDLFIQCPSLQRLHCSLVVPPESSFTDLSLHPNLYTYTISGNTLHYVPEGHHAGSYDQPLDAISWLKLNSIHSPHLNLSVSKLESWGPVHSLLITRGLPHLPSSEKQQVSFHIPNCLPLPEATFLHQPLRHRLVPTEVYDALFTYTRAVRTLRTSDPAGFVRTHSNKPQYSWVTSRAWDNLQTYALLNAPVRPVVLFDFFLSPLKKFQLFMSQHINSLVIKALPFLGLIPPLVKLTTLGFPIPSVSHFQILFFTMIGPSGQFILEAFPSMLHPAISYLESCGLVPRLPPPVAQQLQTMGILRKRSAFSLKTSLSTVKWPSWKITALISALPAALSVFLKTISPLSLQSLHDGYNAHLHPSPFNLSWSLETFHVQSPSPFLPLSLTPPSPSEEIALPPPIFRVPPPLPAQETPSPPAPALVPPTQPPQPQPWEEIISTFLSSLNASSHKPSPSSAPLESPSPIPESFEVLAEAPQHQRSINECGALNQLPLPVPSPLQNSTNPKPPFPSSDLLSDMSCTGPVVEFETIFPAEYHMSNGSFPTRLRGHPRSSAPFPQKHCLLTAVASQLSYTEHQLWEFLCDMLPDSLLTNSEVENFGLSTDHLTCLSYRLHFECIIHTSHSTIPYGIKKASTVIQISYIDGPPKHFKAFIKLAAAAPGSNPSKSNLVRAALRFKYNDAFLPFWDAHQHTISVPHAKNLISNMKNGFDGITSQLSGPSNKSPKMKLLELDATIDVSFPRKCDVIHIAGFPGCGKSHPIQKLLQTPAFRHFRLSVPTNELRSEWKRDLNLPESEVWRLCTWETALFKSSNILVVDEIYKLPRGYLDLILLADPSIQLVIMLGDPLQGEYHSSHPSSSNSRLESETTRLSKYIDCYCWWTYRCPKAVADLFGVKTFNSNEGFIRAVLSHPPNLPNLVNSIATANTMQSLGHHALTISSSQGMTYSDPVTVLLDRHSLLITPQTALVALTRSRSGIYFIGSMYTASGSAGTSYMFSCALTGLPVDMMSAFPLFHTLPLIHEPIRSRRHRLVAGHTPSLHVPPSNKWPHRLHLPPHIPTSHSKDVILAHGIVASNAPERRLTTLHLPPTRLPLHFDLESCNPSTVSTSSTSNSEVPFTHAFLGESFEELAAHFLPAHDPDLKEVTVGDQTSQQFPYLDQPYTLSCQPSSLLAASHKPASDPTLLIFSISKRLRFRASSSPYAFTPNDLILGHLLYTNWCKAFGRCPNSTIPFNPALFAECICLNEYAQLSSKTQATIVSNASRSDPDWRYTVVRIFAKSQHKVNDGSIFGSWKACQTLALMHDFVILTLGPVKKYQRIIDHYDRPNFIYTHCGKTPSELSAWSHSFLKGDAYICNDYTSFDQSQHGEAVIFESLKMHRVGIPRHLIDLHIYLKTNVSTQFGPLTCMRLTGEPGTYDDNTDYNLAVIFSQYVISDHPIMVSGDDSVICGHPPINPNWPAVEKLLHLRFKTEETSLPLFCGYYVGPTGCCRNPFALFAKLMISYDKGNLFETLPSYLYEFSIGHRLGDVVRLLFPDHLLKYYSACWDLFCRKCTASQKLILSFEPIPPSFFSKLASTSRWVSKVLFSDLPTKIRDMLISSSKLPSYHQDPRVQYLESELLTSFNHGRLSTN